MRRRPAASLEALHRPAAAAVARVRRRPAGGDRAAEVEDEKEEISEEEITRRYQSGQVVEAHRPRPGVIKKHRKPSGTSTRSERSSSIPRSQRRRSFSRQGQVQGKRERPREREGERKREEQRCRRKEGLLRVGGEEGQGAYEPLGGGPDKEGVECLPREGDNRQKAKERLREESNRREGGARGRESLPREGAQSEKVEDMSGSGRADEMEEFTKLGHWGRCVEEQDSKALRRKKTSLQVPKVKKKADLRSVGLRGRAWVATRKK